MNDIYTKEQFEEDREKFLQKFEALYFSNKCLNSSRYLYLSFDIVSKNFDVFWVSRNTFVSNNDYILYQWDEWINDDFDFENLEDDIVETFFTLDKDKIKDYINNHEFLYNHQNYLNDNDIDYIINNVIKWKDENCIDYFSSNNIIGDITWTNNKIIKAINNIYEWLYINSELDSLSNELYTKYYNDFYEEEISAYEIIENLKYEDVFWENNISKKDKFYS